MKVYGLSPEHIKNLQKLAYKKIGKKSVSSLAKYLLLQELTNTSNQKQPINNISKESKRLELRLTEHAFTKLCETAVKQNMTINRYAALILHEHTTGEAIPTTKEVQALRESNYQIYKLGVNINQVAKAINMGNATSLTLKELQNLNEAIDKHFGEVGKLLQATRRRLKE